MSSHLANFVIDKLGLTNRHEPANSLVPARAVAVNRWSEQTSSIHVISNQTLFKRRRPAKIDIGSIWTDRCLKTLGSILEESHALVVPRIGPLSSKCVIDRSSIARWSLRVPGSVPI